MKIRYGLFASSIVLSAVFGTVGRVEADIIDLWNFNDTAGTTLNNLSNSGPGGASFAGPGDSSVLTDGSGSLVYNSSGGNQFVSATGIGGADTGQFEVEFGLNAMTRVDTVSAGWIIRDAGPPAANIGVIQFTQNNAGNGLRLYAFTTTGNNLNAFDYGAVSAIDNVTVRAVLTLNGASAGTLQIYALDDNVDLGAGIGVEAYLGSLPTAAGVTFNSVATYKSNFTTGETATFDYLQVSVVPEPASLSLIGLGAMALAIRFRRRR